MNEAREIVVIGVGHPDRADDGVGLALAEELAARRLEGVRVERRRLDAAALLDVWRGAAGVVLLDCVRSGSAPGTVHRLDPFDGLPAGASLGASTHSLGIGEAIELGRALGELPEHLALVGIEGESFAMGGAMTREVRAAMPAAARAVEGILARWRGAARIREAGRA